MNLNDMMDLYQEEGLTRDLASARVCQDIVLKAISDGPLNRNVTVKGGVVMRSITGNNRRATRDIDLDFIHYSLSDEAIREFIRKIDCIDGIKIEIVGEIEELKHQDYHGKRIEITISDDYGNTVRSKVDIGVHKHFDLEQDTYCFDICMDEHGVSLLKNTNEQSFSEKLRSLLMFGPNSRRYKDVYDMYYLKDASDDNKIRRAIQILILDDPGMRETSMSDIVRRITDTFNDEQYMKRASDSGQRWIDEDIHVIATEIIEYISELNLK